MIEPTIIAIKLFESILRSYGFDEFIKLLRPSLDADDRIAKLAVIKEDLEAAIEAVKELQENAAVSKKEASELQSAIINLQEDKKAAEELIKVPEEAFARMLSRATAKGRGRGLIDGVIIGLITGFASSILAWYITTP